MSTVSFPRTCMSIVHQISSGHKCEDVKKEKHLWSLTYLLIHSWLHLELLIVDVNKTNGLSDSRITRWYSLKSGLDLALNLKYCLDIVDSTLIFFNYNHFPTKNQHQPPETKREPILSSFTIYTKRKPISETDSKLVFVFEKFHPLFLQNRETLGTSQTQRLPTTPNCAVVRVWISATVSSTGTCDSWKHPTKEGGRGTKIPPVRGKTTVREGCCQMGSETCGGDIPT